MTEETEKVLSEGSQSEKAPYCVILKPWKQWKGQGLPGVGREGGWIGGAQRIFRAKPKNILCDSRMVDACHFTFVQTYRTYNTKSEP